MGEASAISDYERKFQEKTVKGDYTEIQIKYDEEEPVKTGSKRGSKKSVESVPKKASTLPTSVQVN